MKYILEIKPEYENSFKGVMLLGAKDSNLFVDTLAVDNLEELNSDYINEHYGDLQDTAYQKGINEGYQRGLEDGKWKAEDGCTGCEWEGTPFDVCERCCNNYKNMWKAKDDKIEVEVGDEVERYINGKLDSKGIYLGDTDEEGDYWNCLFWTGAVFTTLAYPKHQFKRTSRHFDIASILKEMQS